MAQDVSIDFKSKISQKIAENVNKSASIKLEILKLAACLGKDQNTFNTLEETIANFTILKARVFQS